MISFRSKFYNAKWGGRSKNGARVFRDDVSIGPDVSFVVVIGT
jgi:hypothetical protein